MKTSIQIFLIFTLFVITGDLKSQEDRRYYRWDTSYVGTSSGIVIRDKPTTQGKIIGRIPFGEKIVYTLNDFHKINKNEFSEDWEKEYNFGPIGWALTKVNGDYGYVFTGYLTHTKIYKTGDIDLGIQHLFEGGFCLGELIYDPNYFWYAVYFSEDEHYNYTSMKPVIINISTYTENPDGAGIFINTNIPEKSFFLVGFRDTLIGRPLYTQVKKYFWNEPKTIFPGEKVKFCASISSLYAFGNSDSVNVYNYPIINDYRLYVSFKDRVQDITNEINTNLETGFNTIRWYGDLNGDNSPEILLTAGSTKMGISTLLMGSEYFDDSTSVIRKVSSIKEWNCY